MENFYDKLKDKFSDPPKEATDWSMWENLESVLNEKRRRFFPLWWWTPLALIGSFALGYVMNDSGVSKNQSQFQKKIITDTVYITRTEYTVDTIWNTKTIYQLDRVLKNKVATLSISNVQLKNEINALKEKSDKLRLLAVEYRNLIKDSPYIAYEPFQILNRSRFVSDLLPPLNEIEAVVQHKNSTTLLTDLAFLPTIGINQLVFQEERVFIRNPMLKNLIETSRRKQSLGELLIPDYINLGLTSSGPLVSFNDAFGAGSEMGFGLGFEMLFSNKFRIETGIISSKIKGSESVFQDTEIYPQPANISPDENFAGLNIKLSKLEIPIILKYRLSHNSNYELYLMSGISAGKLSGEEYIYEFTRGSDEIYYEVKGVAGSWKVSNGYFGAGIKFGLFDRLKANVEPHFKLGLNTLNEDLGRSHGVGIRLGIFYEM